MNIIRGINWLFVITLPLMAIYTTMNPHMLVYPEFLPIQLFLLGVAWVLNIMGVILK